jgi:hypothetical protein
MIASTIDINTKVTTPNGTGISSGHIWEYGTLWVLVRHKLAEMTGRAAGVCLTPRAVLQGLWRYERQEVTQ